MLESRFSSGPSRPPVVQIKTPPEVSAPQSLRKTLSLRSSGTCQILSHAVMKSYCLPGIHSIEIGLDRLETTLVVVTE